jgi:hypothetical protein
MPREAECGSLFSESAVRAATLLWLHTAPLHDRLFPIVRFRNPRRILTFVSAPVLALTSISDVQTDARES